MEFTHYPFTQLEGMREQSGIHIDSFADIAAGKLMALLDRFDPKDFVDLFFIIKQLPLQDVRKNAEKKFGNTIGSMFLGRELMKVKRIVSLPYMVRPLTIEGLNTAFVALAREVGEEVME